MRGKCVLVERDCLRLADVASQNEQYKLAMLAYGLAMSLNGQENDKIADLLLEKDKKLCFNPSLYTECGCLFGENELERIREGEKEIIKQHGHKRCNNVSLMSFSNGQPQFTQETRSIPGAFQHQHLINSFVVATVALGSENKLCTHLNKNFQTARYVTNSGDSPFRDSGPFTFDYLLGEDRNFTSSAEVLFVDHDIAERYIRQISSSGKSVICYVNVGAWENWRDDAADFPEVVLGYDYDGWPGERWLDVRNIKVVLPIMRRRFQDAAAKGCEGIDPDNMNGWSVRTGFPISFNQQLLYNEAIAREIRRLGMLAGLKNDNEQAWQLEPFNDFAVVEECAHYRECGDFEAFIGNNKPVFGIEYTDYWSKDTFENRVCPLTEDTGISFILKHLELHNDFIVSCL